MIDWDRVRKLRDEVGEDAFDEVVEMFLDEVSETLAALPQDRGSAEMRDAMHFLKGSALSLGFHAFAETCSRAEADESQRAALDLAALSQQFDLSRVHFLEGLPGHLG